MEQEREAPPSRCGASARSASATSRSARDSPRRDPRRQAPWPGRGRVVDLPDPRADRAEPEPEDDRRDDPAVPEARIPRLRWPARSEDEHADRPDAQQASPTFEIRNIRTTSLGTSRLRPPRIRYVKKASAETRRERRGDVQEQKPVVKAHARRKLTHPPEGRLRHGKGFQTRNHQVPSARIPRRRAT